MAGRKPRVTRETAIAIIEKYTSHFTTNNFPPRGAAVWKLISANLDGQRTIGTAYNHNRENKRGDLAQARLNQGISSSSPKRKLILIDEISENGEDI